MILLWIQRDMSFSQSIRLGFVCLAKGMLDVVDLPTFLLSGLHFICIVRLIFGLACEFGCVANLIPGFLSFGMDTHKLYLLGSSFSFQNRRSFCDGEGGNWEV